MKFTSLLLLLVVLASCGTEVVVPEEISVPETVIEQTNSAIDAELEKLEEASTSESEEPITEDDVTITEDTIEVQDGDTTVTVDQDTIVVTDGDSSVTIDEDSTVTTGSAEVSDTPVVAEEAEAKVVKVQATYNNPKQAVAIDLEYTLDSEGKISEIEVINSNYDLTGQLGDINVLVGKSLSEVEDTYISGGSLTVPAIKSALSAGA